MGSLITFTTQVKKGSEIKRNCAQTMDFFCAKSRLVQAQYLYHSASELIETWLVCKEILQVYTMPKFVHYTICRPKDKRLSTITVSRGFDRKVSKWCLNLWYRPIFTHQPSFNSFGCTMIEIMHLNPNVIWREKRQYSTRNFRVIQLLFILGTSFFLPRDTADTLM